MMLDDTRSLERQRLAWIVLLIAFAIFTILCLSLPFIANATLQNSTQLLETLVQANQGTVGIDDKSGDRGAVITGDPGRLIQPGEHVLTGNNATALITMRPPESEQNIATFQIFSNTDFHLLEADTPRFDISNHGHAISLRLENGRVRLTLPEDGERPSTVFIATPQGDVTIAEPGQYAVIITTEDTQITVREGLALIEAEDGSLEIASGSRARIPTGFAPVGPLGTERNLVTNSGFDRDTNEWIINPWIVDLAAQPEGQVRVLEEGGIPRLNVARQGTGQAEVSIRQAINQDVNELASLRLLLNFQVLNQSLGVCGVKGSECPLFMRINYVDQGGARNTWQQGFYASGEVDAELTPDTCVTCAMIQGPHLRVPLQQDYFFEIEDFRDELARHGRLPPRFIESISLVFSGHTFEVEVGDVALLAEE